MKQFKYDIRFFIEEDYILVDHFRLYFETIEQLKDFISKHKFYVSKYDLSAIDEYNNGIDIQLTPEEYERVKKEYS